jgi:alginate O-acetyltransferase complex protein AlgI
MLFNSVEFIFVFLPLSLLSFYFVRQMRSSAASMLCLLVASLVFYVYWKADAIVLLAASVAVNYLVGAQIDKARRRGDGWHARTALVIGLGLNLGALGYFKYTGFFLQNLATLFPGQLDAFQIALPLGISFFTFTQITFLVDTYRGLAAGRDPLRYALFVAFFPHLIAGPILKYRDIDAQLATEGFGRITAEDMALGTAFFAIGLFKKLILADPIGTYVQPVFSAAQAGVDMTLWEAWAGAIAFTMQIYFDFSGYCDMAIGLGLMFGLRLPINFDSPYQATSIVDF